MSTDDNANATPSVAKIQINDSVDSANHHDLVVNTILAQKIMDGWRNVAAGLGNVAHDARVQSEVGWRRLTEPELEHLYAGDAMAAKVVDLPVDDATKEGYEWTGIKPEQKDKLKARLEELYFDASIAEAAKKARLYGGSLIVKAYNDDLRLEKPATPGKKKELKALVVLQRFDVPAYWQDVQQDFLSTEYQNPILYTFTNRTGVESMEVGVKIHFTRCVRFDGAWLPDQLRRSNSYWGDSVLSRPYDAIRNYAFAHDSVNAALKDLSVGVYKIKGLADLIGANCDDKIIRRFQIVNLVKSMVRAVILDSEGEDFEYKARNLTGAHELVDKAEGRIASETNIPRTVLLGESPRGGIGQSGDHQAEIWYDFVDSYQRNTLRPSMLEIAKEVCEELGIDHKDLDIVFNPLWQQSGKEQAEERKINAETDAIYMDQGVISTEEVRESRFGGDKYSAEISLDPSTDLDELKPQPIMPNNPLAPNEETLEPSNKINI